MTEKFIKTHSNYKDEKYIADCNWNNIKVQLCVNMHYHTCRKWWTVSYWVNYGDYWTFCLNENTYKYYKGRKEAREIANNFMSAASVSDIDKLTEFQKNAIKKDGKLYI